MYLHGAAAPAAGEVLLGELGPRALGLNYLLPNAGIYECCPEIYGFRAGAGVLLN